MKTKYFLLMGAIVFLLVLGVIRPGAAGPEIPRITINSTMLSETLKVLQPATQEELNSDAVCSLIADRNVRDLREQGYMATKVIVENHAGSSHALTGVVLLFDTDGHLLTPEEFNAYYKFKYRDLVDGRLWGVYESQVWDTIEDSENFECSCWREI